MSGSDRRRTCVGCRRRAHPSELRRLARGPDGVVRVGPGVPGRGAWVCSVECFDRADRRGAVGRALRCELPADEVAALRARLMC